MNITVPAAMQIEMAADEVVKLPQAIRDDQQKELSSLGDPVFKALGASGLTEDFQKGYELGLQTMRVMATPIS